MRSTNIKRMLPVVVALGLNALASNVQASFIQLGQTNSYSYFEDFDNLVSSGKSKTVPNGWWFQEYGNTDGYIQADDGSGSFFNGSMYVGGAYSYGQAGSSDRAFGTFNDGKGNYSIFGAAFQNTGPSSINRLNVSYTGEEWRLGVAGQRNQLQFQYSLGASGVTDAKATWINSSALSFFTPNLSGVGAHDGTLAANQVHVAGTISFLNIPTGGTLWVRWQEPSQSNKTPGDGLAVDNFSISAVPELGTNLAAMSAACLLGFALIRRRATGSTPAA